MRNKLSRIETLVALAGALEETYNNVDWSAEYGILRDIGELVDGLKRQYEEEEGN